MNLAEQLRAIADRLEAAEAERIAALLELRGALALHPVSWDPTEPNADDFAAHAIEQPALGPAGAGDGEAAATPISAPAPIDAPGQARQDDARVNGRRARAAVAPPQRPSSAPTGTPAPAIEAEPSSSSHKKGPSPGNVIAVVCACGRHFTWKPGLVNHQRVCDDYLEAITRPAIAIPVDPAGGDADGPPVSGSPVAKPTPWSPEPVAKADSVIKNGRERWLCARCTESFNTPEKRDEHQRFHPPVPVVAGPVGRGRRSVVDRVATGGGSLR